MAESVTCKHGNLERRYDEQALREQKVIPLGGQAA